MKKSAAWKSAKSHRSHGAGDFRRRSRHPSPPDHENNLFGDGNDGEKENLATASDVRDQAIKPASEESEPVSLRTRSKHYWSWTAVKWNTRPTTAIPTKSNTRPTPPHVTI